MTTLIDRIQKMENIMNEVEKGMSDFEEALETFKATQAKINKLEAYYFSDVWKDDKKADNEGKIPKNINTGILSEDGIWNLSVRNRELGIDLIKLGVSMIDK